MTTDTTDTTRAEKLQISIDDTEQEIQETQHILEQLEDTNRDIKDDDITSSFQLVIEKCENKINFLEGIKENDEEILRGII